MSMRRLISLLLYAGTVFAVAYPMVGSMSGQPGRWVCFRDPIDPSKPVASIATWGKLRPLGQWMRPAPQFAAWDPNSPAARLAPDLRIVEDCRSGKRFLVPVGGGEPDDPNQLGLTQVNYPQYIAYLRASSSQRPAARVTIREGIPYVLGQAADHPPVRITSEAEVKRLARECYDKPDPVGFLKEKLAASEGGKLLADGLIGINVAPEPLPWALLISGTFLVAGLAWQVLTRTRHSNEYRFLPAD